MKFLIKFVVSFCEIFVKLINPIIQNQTIYYKWNLMEIKHVLN